MEVWDSWVLSPRSIEKNNCSAAKTIHFALQDTNSYLQSACLSHSLGRQFCWIQLHLGFLHEKGPCQD